MHLIYSNRNNLNSPFIRESIGNYFNKKYINSKHTHTTYKNSHAVENK